MWLQSTPPVTNRWVLHVAATTSQVTAVLRELCVDDEQPRYNGDETFPVYLRGSGSPYGPPEWMSVARAELNRRGYPTRWCTPTCRHHPWPPRTEAQPARDGAGRSMAARDRTRGFAGRSRPRTPVRRLTGSAPHHRVPSPAPATPTGPVTA